MPAYMALVAAFAGAGVAAISASTRAPIVAIATAAIAFETTALRPRLDDEVESRAVVVWRRVEFVGLIVGVKLLQVLSGRQTLIDAELTVSVITAILVWGLVNSTLTDLDAVRRAVDVVDGATPVQRIRSRFVAVGVLVAGCAAAGAVGLDGFLDLGRTATRRWSIAPLGYLVVGLVGLGVVSRLAETRRWQRDGVAIDGDVPGRWVRGVGSVVVVLALLGTALSFGAGGATGLPADGIAASGGLGRWLVDRTEAIRGSVSATSDRATSGDTISTDTPAIIETTDPVAPWLGDVALWVLVALVFATAVIRGRNRRMRARAGVAGGPGVLEAIRLMLDAVWRLLVDVWKALRGVARAVAGRMGTARGAGWDMPAGGRRAWRPSDPIRRRIARAYRAASDVLTPAHGGRSDPETVREYAARVEDRRFDVVARRFEEARYSDHVLGERDATDAEAASDALAGGESD